MALSLQQFIDNLSQTGLMSAAEVSTICERLPPEERPADGEALAKLLVRQGKLTKYQASAIYQGKHQNLVFGEYVILDKLGAGGMGVVLKAQHRRMKRIVAIKVLPAAAMKNARRGRAVLSRGRGGRQAESIPTSSPPTTPASTRGCTSW